MQRTLTIHGVIATIIVLLVVQDAQAQDDKKLGWEFTSEFSFVQTAGNSQAGTLGLDVVVRHIWPKSVIKFDAGGIQTESSLTTTTATGSAENFEVREDKVTEKTAEAFYSRIRYDYQFSERFFTFGGADWLRNRFAGIESRFLVALGAGNVWADSERIRFKTDYGFTYTFQDDVVANPFLKTNFPGLRVAYDFWSQLTTSTEFESRLTLDWNLNNTDDVRITFYNGLPISINSHLLLKPALTLLWRNDPSLQKVSLFNPDGTDTGTTVLVPLKKLDSFFNLTLVLKF